MTVLSKPYTERDGSEFQPYEDFTVEYRGSSHRYWIHQGEQRTAAISVTSALKVLDKPSLLNWAEECGARGALILERRGELRGVDPSAAVDVVRINKLGHEGERNKGGGRGSAIHDALRLWSTSGTVPNPSDFPAEFRGYLQGLFRWLSTADPTPILVEQIVASPKHGYAGRLDLVAELQGRRTLIDLKTNPKGRVYPEAHIQATAYALALRECGIEPVDCLTVVGVGEDSSFTRADCCADPEDFLAVLACHRMLARVRSAQQSLAKAAA